jgi:hypothetical protein
MATWTEIKNQLNALNTKFDTLNASTLKAVVFLAGDDKIERKFQTGEWSEDVGAMGNILTHLNCYVEAISTLEGLIKRIDPDAPVSQSSSSSADGEPVRRGRKVEGT